MRAPPRPSISTGWSAITSSAGGPSVADLQVNLLPKDERRAQSHEIAKRVRPALAAIAAKYGAAVAVAEVPPGPPVLQTLVAEIYAPDEASRLKLATQVREIFRSTPGVVDVDWYVEAEQPKTLLHIDQAKAALQGVTEASITRTVQMAAQGYPVTLMHLPNAREPVNVVLELPRALRARPDDLLALPVRSEMNPQAPLVPLRELVTLETVPSERNIYHKNLQNVTYVTGDVAGVIESPGLCDPQDEPRAWRSSTGARTAARRKASRSTIPRCPPMTASRR